MSKIKLIALDLDGTLLNSNKELSERNKKALELAAAQGVEIVPATGRLYSGMPDEVRKLDFIHYSINVNGATVYDLTGTEKKRIIDIGMDVDFAVKVMQYLDGYDVIYDCYIGDEGFMSQSHLDKAQYYVGGPYYALVKNYRKPVPDLKEYIAKRNEPIHKMQLLKMDSELIRHIFNEMKEKFPEADITSSISDNIEICDIHANKGESLAKLAKYLGLEKDEVMACGDGGNDLNLMRNAGLGVAMGDGIDEIKKLASYVTANCDDDGVAVAIEKFVL